MTIPALRQGMASLETAGLTWIPVIMSLLLFIPALLQPFWKAGAGMEPAVGSYALYYGEPSPRVVAKLKTFELVIIEPRAWTDDEIRELQSGGVTVLGYMTTLAVDQKAPHFTGLREADYLRVEGRRITNNGEAADWLLDPRSRHLHDVIADAVQSSIYARGLDGVFLDTLDQVTDYLFAWVAPSSPGYEQLKDEMFRGAAELVRRIRALNPDGLIAQNNGWRELKSYTAPYIDILVWENYPYRLRDTNQWVNTRREELNDLRTRHGIRIFALGVLPAHAATEMMMFYCWSLKYGFSPYVALEGYGSNNINTQGYWLASLCLGKRAIASPLDPEHMRPVGP